MLTAIEDLNLSKKEFTDVHGGIRLHDNDFVVCDARPAKYGIRLYIGCDGLTSPIRLQTKSDLKKASKILRALMYGRVGESSYKNGDFETTNKKEFVEYLINREI